MNKLIIVASVVVLAASSAACGSHNDSDSSSASITGPSSTDAKGGGGGGGKPGGSTGGTGSLALVMVSDNNTNGLPNWGDTVTFNVSTTATTEPTVDLVCSQNGVAVYGATAGFYTSYPWPWTKQMTLSSSAWKSGAADCTATLHALGSGSILATVRFTAGS